MNLEKHGEQCLRICIIFHPSLVCSHCYNIQFSMVMGTLVEAAAVAVEGAAAAGQEWIIDTDLTNYMSRSCFVPETFNIIMFKMHGVFRKFLLLLVLSSVM
jgi:hypothetical protein